MWGTMLIGHIMVRRELDCVLLLVLQCYVSHHEKFFTKGLGQGVGMIPDLMEPPQGIRMFLNPENLAPNLQMGAFLARGVARAERDFIHEAQKKRKVRSSCTLSYASVSGFAKVVIKVADGSFQA